jgi:hypothetical protein
MKKILHTYFFGYAAYKYRRLIRTLILLICVVTAYSIGFWVFENEDYNMALELFGFMTAVLLTTSLISFLIEPFIIEKTKNELYEKIIKSTKNDNFESKKGNKFLINKIISYFRYDGSYISGNKYGFRKLLQWPLIFLLIGFYLRAVTTYYRSKSLKISTIGSLLFSIYSVFIDFYIILIIPFNEKSFGVVPEMLWVFIFPILPFTYLIFMDGKNDDTNDKAQKN